MSNPMFKYTDVGHKTVFRTWPDNSCESHLIEAEVVQQYLAVGGVILAEDPPAPGPQPSDMSATCVAGITAPPVPQFGFDIRRAFIAKAISDEAYRLGVAPGALTPAQLAALRTRLANIYAAL